MTKAKTRGQKRRARSRIDDAGIHDLEPITRRQPSGRRPSGHIKPDIETLKSRCIRMGKSITPANLREMSAPWWGCAAGRVIGQTVMHDSDRQDLWTAIVHMRRVVTAHDAALGLPRRHAVCMRLLAPVDEMRADADTPPADLRDPETRQRQASAAMMRVEGWLGYTDNRSMGEAKRVVIDDAICTDPDGLILALRCVSDGLKGRRMQYRGRA